MRILMTVLAMTIAVPIGATIAPASAEARSWHDNDRRYDYRDYREARRDRWREQRRREYYRELRRDRRAAHRHWRDRRYDDRYYGYRRGW